MDLKSGLIALRESGTCLPGPVSGLTSEGLPPTHHLPTSKRSGWLGLHGLP